MGKEFNILWTMSRKNYDLILKIVNTDQIDTELRD